MCFDLETKRVDNLKQASISQRAEEDGALWAAKVEATVTLARYHEEGKKE
jgi:hypothetical protein